MNKEQHENLLDDEVIAYEEEEEEEEEEEDQKSSVNIPLSGSPLYPRIYLGDAAEGPGQFPESEYVDDNISRTYMGLLTGFYG
jgi:hypothetical protein